MPRICIAFVLAAAALAGCGESSSQMAMSMPPHKAAPAPEMKKLTAWLGHWTGQAEIISPTKEEMMKHMPSGSPPPPMTSSSHGHAEWALGGHFLKNEGWYDMGGVKAQFVEFMTWDSKAGKFHSWYFSDGGEVGEGWLTFAADGKSASMRVAGRRPDGMALTGEGTMDLSRTGRIPWVWSETGPMGTFTMKGENIYAGGAPDVPVAPGAASGALEMQAK